MFPLDTIGPLHYGHQRALSSDLLVFFAFSAAGVAVLGEVVLREIPTYGWQFYY